MISYIKHNPNILIYVLSGVASTIAAIGLFILRLYLDSIKHTREIKALWATHHKAVADIKAQAVKDNKCVYKELDELKDVAQVTNTQVVERLDKITDKMILLGEAVARIEGRLKIE